jgi:hypothetical protein
MHADRRLDARRRRLKVLLVLSAATVFLHAALLGGVAPAGFVAPTAVPPPAMTVRTIEPAPVVIAAVEEIAVAAVEPAPPPRPAPKVRSRPAPARAVEPAVVAVEPPSDAALVPDLQIALQDSASAPQPALAASSPNDVVVPTYRSQAPPSANLRYLMQRGILRGTGEMTWRNDGERYELKLDGSALGLSIITQASTGIFDSAGLAPVRFTDQRLKRQVNAANLQRDAGKITFSGPSTVYPIWPGTQDRLSWMIQVCAIAAGDPSVLKPGAKIAMHIVGARGDAAIWALRYVGREKVETLGASTIADKFERVSPDPTDTMAEIWLDPQRHYLPVRAVLRNPNDSEALELILQQLTMVP